MTMLERLVESRVAASFAVGAVVWIAGRFGAPFPEDHAILQLVRVERPLVYDSIAGPTRSSGSRPLTS